jgi:hypothetical protein
MILPEIPENDFSHYAPSRLDNSELKDRPTSMQSPYVGGALRASESGSASGTYAGVAKSASNMPAAQSKRRHSSVSSRRPSKADEDDPGILLEIIRELVEETSEWDPNTIFMSQSFRSLLEDSGITPSISAQAEFLASEAGNTQDTSGFAESTSDLSGRSAEVDLGLLGLDIFRNESFYPVGSHAADDSTNLVSFWDEDSSEL